MSRADDRADFQSQLHRCIVIVIADERQESAIKVGDKQISERRNDMVIEFLTDSVVYGNERHRIRCTDEELVHIGLSVADGSMDYPELLEWVMGHKE